MIGGIIGLISCFMCAVPFLIMGVYGKDSKEPITFWAGDKELKTKVKDISQYNKEMSGLYMKCAIAFGVTGVICLFWLLVGIVLICAECILGIFFVYMRYKKILKRYT